MPNSQHSSKSNEHYTPEEIIKSVHTVMGSIDLDPASSPVANKTINANNYYTIIDDGLTKSWHGSIFLNPPGGCVKYKNGKWQKVSAFGQSYQAVFWDKLIEEYEKQNVTDAIFLAFSIELIGKRPGILNYPICFINNQTSWSKQPENNLITVGGRIKFNKPLDDGSIKRENSPTHCNCIVYIPPKYNHNQAGARIRKFYNEFSKFGSVGLFMSETIK